MRAGQGAGGWAVALAVGLPLAAAGTVVAVVLGGGGSAAPSPLHQAVDSYLEPVGRGARAPAPGPDTRCPAGGDPEGSLRALAAEFGHRIVSSTRSGDGAVVNVDLAPPAGDRIEAALELRRSGDRWDVCSASRGHVEIDPF
ncbi:hypothetical protein [Streptomyces sp. 2P-4]|uniref:hypothetical protein n=1 Tax=Streptomyces sp. 2P-4 TaxID=2931974 RepID=UPI0025413421|nr:hypothetical protein [Streptomyces sp. 2P-4]